MNIKYTYKWTAKEDYGIPDNNYSCETYYVILDENLSFYEYLSEYVNDGNYGFEVEEDKESGTYYIVNNDGERTGEAYLMIKEEETTEEQQGF